MPYIDYIKQMYSFFLDEDRAHNLMSMNTTAQSIYLSSQDAWIILFISRLVWRLKDKGHILVIKWSIFCNAKLYSSGAMHCQLCLAEKLATLWADPDTTLNKRSELVAKCRHRNKYKLIKIPPS